MDSHSNCVHFKADAQFWDVLFSTIFLTCLLSLSFSIIQAEINTEHTPVRKSREGEANLSLNLDYGFVSIYVWPLKQKKQWKTLKRSKVGKLEGSMFLSTLTLCSEVTLFSLSQLLHHPFGPSKAAFSLTCLLFAPQSLMNRGSITQVYLQL